jgi:hypothetical protein
VWTVGSGLETAREVVPFEVQGVVGFTGTGVKGWVNVVVDNGRGFA